MHNPYTDSPFEQPTPHFRVGQRVTNTEEFSYQRGLSVVTIMEGATGTVIEINGPHLVTVRADGTGRIFGQSVWKLLDAGELPDPNQLSLFGGPGA